MNGYERIMRAIAGEKVDHAPVWPFVMSFAAKYAGVPYGKFASDYREMARALIKTAEDFDLDAITVDSDAYREASACGAVLEFPEDNLPIVRKQAITNREHFDLPYHKIEDCERLMDKIYGVDAVKRHFGGDKAVCGWVEAPLQCAGTLYAMNDYMEDIFEDPDFVTEILEYVTEMDIRFAVMQAQAGADIIGIGDAMASLVSPTTYRSYFLPYTKKLVEGIRAGSKDVKLKYHICGKSAHLLPFVEEIGFDIVNIDHPVDLAAAVEATHGKVCIKGNVNPVTLLSSSDDAIRESVRALLDVHAPRFILSPGCEVGKFTPPEKLHVFVEAAKQ